MTAQLTNGPRPVTPIHAWRCPGRAFLNAGPDETRRSAGTSGPRSIDRPPIAACTAHPRQTPNAGAATSPGGH